MSRRTSGAVVRYSLRALCGGGGVFLIRLSVVAAGVSILLVTSACGGGGPSSAGKTNTAVANGAATQSARAAATATQLAIDGPVPTADEIAGVITQGFDGLDEIEYTAVSIPTFRKRDQLLGVLNDCAQSTGGGRSPEGQDYWPTVLGDCYLVGDALNWLYGYTARQEFLYANIMMERYHRQKFEQAVAAGYPLAESYWDGVQAKIYDVKPSRTPIAVTPPAISTSDGTPSPD